MRQKNVIWIATLVTVVVIATIAVFAIVRQSGHMGNHDVNTGHHHNEMQNSDTQEDIGAQDHHEKEGSSNIEPSGVLKDGQRVVKVKARQFEFDPSKIVVKKGEKVRLEVTSEDVTHGVNIEAFDIDRQLEPGKTEVITFTADKAGQFHFHCSVYCGKGHSDMHGELIILD